MVGGCLFDLEKDLAEEHDLYHASAMQEIVANLTRRLQEAGATGPPWAHPFDDPTGKGHMSLEVAQANCDLANRNGGFIEPEFTSPPAGVLQG
jgi:hypothetical protein